MYFLRTMTIFTALAALLLLVGFGQHLMPTQPVAAQQAPRTSPPSPPTSTPASSSPTTQAPAPPQQQPAPQQPAKDPKQPERRDAREDAKDEKQGEPVADDSNTIKLDTNLVNLDVFVIDQNNAPALNLTKENFTVHEDRVKQQVDDVSITEVPLSFGLVIDTSGSMRSKLQTVTDAGMGIIRSMQTDDEGFVASFKAEPELIQDFTPDKRELEEAMGNLYTSGGTSLLDAIIATADYAQEKGKHRRKAIVVISDGVEKNSSVKEKEVLEAIKEDEVQIYLVGFIDEEEMSGGIFGKSGGKKAKDLLQRIADDSGGRAFFPKDVSEMAAIANQIAKDLRTQYVLSYYPTNDAEDGTFRSVRVSVQGKDGRRLIARTRQGYYAKRGAGAAPPPATAPVTPEKRVRN